MSVESMANHKTIISSLTAKSEEEIINEFNNYSDTETEQLYCQILFYVKIAILESQIGDFQYLCRLINVITNIKPVNTLKTYFDNPNNPIRNTNLVILACKRNTTEILAYLFSSENKVLDNLSIRVEKNAILPHDLDEECHNAVYYALRSNNVRLLAMLINKWSYFNTHLEELNEMFLKAGEELKLENISLSAEMQNFVQEKRIAEKVNIIAPVDLVYESIESKQRCISSKAMFSSVALKPETEMEKEIRECDETKVKGLYFQILTEIKEAVSVDNIENLKKVDRVIVVLNKTQNNMTLNSYYESDENPIGRTNLVILACKHNAIKVLEYLFSNKSKILGSLSIDIKAPSILPKSEDDECHNPFYYAIRSNNIELLDTLITTWPDHYFDIHLDDLDEILSKAYEEIKLKNMLLSHEMEVFVENRLINLRFFAKDSEDVKCFKFSLNNIKERIGLVLENIYMLIEEYSDVKEIDGKFLVAAKFIACNIHILKKQLKPTYKSVPWEEMEFCLVVFVRSKLMQDELNLLYSFILTKKRIIMHLENFAAKLTKTSISEEVFSKNSLPREKRETVMSIIISEYSQFGELYHDYTKVADINSLDKICNCIDLALLTNPGLEEDRLVIRRVLQIIGEYLKNTLESPKLSETTRELLLLSVPKNTSDILTNLRDVFAHEDPFSKGIEMGENFFNNIQNDIKKIGTIVADILFRNKIKTCRAILKSIIDSESLEEIRQLAEGFCSMKIQKPVLKNCKAPENKQIKDLIEKLRSIADEKTKYEESLFKKIEGIFIKEESILRDERLDYSIVVSVLKGLKLLLRCKKRDHASMKEIKSYVRRPLETLSPKMKSSGLIAEVALEIADHLKPRLDVECINEVNRIILQIFHVAQLECDNIKWIEQLQEKLSKNKFEKFSQGKVSKQKKSVVIPQEDWSKQLAEKLSMLKSILNDNALNCQSIKDNWSCKTSGKLKMAIEMLIQDAMSNLVSSKNCLTDSLLFLDDNVPLLNGKPLRDHLAHDNALIDILPFDPSITIVSNARKLILEDMIANSKYVGKLVKDSPLLLKSKHERNLQTVINQEALFSALEDGNFEKLQNCIEKGADINARSIKLWTALHFAAKGPSLEVVKFVFRQNSIATDADGQNPLHIAAAYGQTCTVEFFVSQKDFNINDVDNYWQTPLHLAARNGHSRVVEILLKKGAITMKKDINDNLPIQYAVRNNYKDITLILLQKEKSDNVKEIMGGFSLLHIAAANGHLEILQFLLQNNANGKDDRNQTPLHAAASNGHLEVVKTLLSHGANVNAKILTNWRTPLHYALRKGNEKIVEILLEHLADVNAADNIYNHVPLHYAAQSGYVKIVEILLKANNVDVNISASNGMRPLHFATFEGHEEIVDLLLKKDALVDIKENHGYTALHLSSFNGNKSITELLIKYDASIHSEDDNCRRPLHYASIAGHKEIVELLIAKGAVVHFKDSWGCTALHLCSQSGYVDVMDVLIRNGADTNARDRNGNTPLHFVSGNCYDEETTVSVFKHVTGWSAKSKNDTGKIMEIVQARHTDFDVRNKIRKDGEMIKLLLDNKADINAKCNNNVTPLHLVTLNGNVEALEALIERVVDVNVEDKNKYTPLHMAAHGNHKKFIEILLWNRADVGAKTLSGHSPLFFAVKYNYKEIVQLLIKRGADVNAEGSLSCAIVGGFKDIVESLLKNKNFDIRHPANSEVLHRAAERGFKYIVEALIAKGADVNAVIFGGLRPLHVAAQKDHKDVVQLLLAKEEVDVNSKCNDGCTPLHLAAKQGHNEIVKLLLHKADINIRNNNKNTALALATSYGGLKVVKTLLEYVDVNNTAEGDDELPILHVASNEGKLEIIKYLIDAGAEIHARNKLLGSKAIHLATRAGHTHVVEFFLNHGCSIDDLDETKNTLLHYAAKDDRLKTAEYLLKLNIGVNVPNCTDSRPIHTAACTGSENVVKLLLSNGAIYNIVNKFNDNAWKAAEEFAEKPEQEHREEIKNIITLLSSTENLFKAVRCGNASDVENYVKTGGFVNAKNRQHIMPLHFAAWKGYEEVVSVLLRHQANPNAIGKGGCTPLHYAAKFSHFRIVKRLLSSGAVYNIVSDNFKTPLDFSEDQAIVDLLKLVARFFEKIQNCDPRVVDDLKQVKDIDTIKVVMNACNKRNETLMVAAVHNDFPKMEKLNEVVLGDEYVAIEMANHLILQEKYADALNIFHKVHKKMENILGSENPCTLDIQNHIAKTVYAEKKYLEALPLFQKMYEKQKKILGPKNRDTLITRTCIASIQYEFGKVKEASEIYQEIYVTQNEIFGENDSSTLSTKLSIARVLVHEKKYEEALSISYEVFQKRIQMFGSNHVLTLSAWMNIAMILSYQSKYEEAISIYEAIYEVRKRDLGPAHSASLYVLSSIAAVYSREEKYDDALKAYQEVFNLQKKNLGSNHPNTLLTKYNIANIFLNRGNLIRALETYKESLHQSKYILEAEHPLIRRINSKLRIVNLRLKYAYFDDSPEFLYSIHTEIFTAAEKGDERGILQLLNEGINVDASDAEGRTPLHFAAYNGHKEIVIILLKNDADPSIASDKGNTPLHIATSRCHKEIVEMLLKHVEQENLNKLRNFINARTTISGSTALHIACKNGSFEIVKCLLKYGSVYNYRDKCNNKTPVDYSKDQNITNLLNLVDQLFKSRNREIIHKLLELSPDELQAVRNACNDDGRKIITNVFY